MNIMFDLNLCKFTFGALTIFMVLMGAVINIFEKYIPVFFTRTFRYGKFACTQDSIVKPVELPKSSFRHFYFAAAVIYYPIAFNEVISVYIFQNEPSNWFSHLMNFMCGPNRTVTVSATHTFIAVILMMLQVYRRCYETFIISVFSPQAKINLAHYIVGMIYYPGVMLLILSEAPGFVTSSSLPKLELNSIGALEIFSIALFLWGWYHQHISAVILANLRKNDKGEVISQKYEIPQGDWFQYLSSPHLSAEIVMYSALTLLLADNSGWWYVYAWVLSSQIESILLSHWWYQSHFKSFPTHKKALIPYVY